MDSSIEEISPVECRVHVTIPWDEVGKRLDGKLRDLRRRARVPGFRAGKVPPKMIERMYGKGAREELALELIQETFQTAVTKHERQPLGDPKPESHSLERGEPFKYAARFEVVPKIEPKDYEGVPVRRRPAAASDEKLQAALEAKQKEHTEIRPVPEDSDRKETRKGDLWTFDMKGTFGEHEIDHKEVRVEIGIEEGAPEPLPGLAAQLESLVLADVGSEKEITYTPPQDRLKDEFKGLEIALTLTLTDVREKVVPELDDDLAQDTGEAETLDELKEKLRANILEEDQAEAERDARRRLVVELLERNPFDPAPSLVEQETAAKVNMFQQQLAQQGLRPEQLGMNQNTLYNQMRGEALFNVKAFLLLDAIGKAHEIDVTDEEVDAEVTAMAEEQGQNAARLRARMQKSQELVLLRAQIREEKILDFLMEKAEVTEEPDPVEEPAGETAGDGDGADAD